MLSNGRKSLRHIRTRLGRLDDESLQIIIDDYLEGKPYLGVFGGIFDFFWAFAEEYEVSRGEYSIARKILEKRQRN